MAKKTRSKRSAQQRRRPQQRSLAPGAPVTRPSAAVAPPPEVDEAELLEADETDLADIDADVDDEVGSATPAPVRTAPAPMRPGVGPRVARPAAPVAPAPAGPRRAGRLDPGQRRAPRPGRPGSTAALFEPLDPDDDAIPFDRVPYVPSDLRRVAVIASMMIALIIIAAVVVTNVVK